MYSISRENLRSLVTRELVPLIQATLSVDYYGAVLPFSALLSGVTHLS